MLTLNEAVAKVTNPRIKVRDMEPFTDDEVEGGLAFIANDVLTTLQEKHEEQRHSGNAFIRAQQHLYDTYEYNEDGEYDIPAENVEDLALLQFVNDRNILLSELEAEILYKNLDGSSKIFELYQAIKG